MHLHDITYKYIIYNAMNIYCILFVTNIYCITNCCRITKYHYVIKTAPYYRNSAISISSAGLWLHDIISSMAAIFSLDVLLPMDCNWLKLYKYNI